jgi:hypothetical protein
MRHTQTSKMQKHMQPHESTQPMQQHTTEVHTMQQKEVTHHK